MLLNEKNRELKLVIAALALTACHVLGIDAQAAMQLLGNSPVVDPAITDLTAIIKEAHLPTTGVDWKSIASMWLGVSAYSFGRQWLKGKGLLVESSEK